MLRLLLPLLFGILLLPLPLRSWAIAIALLSLIGLGVQQRGLLPYRYRWLAGLLLSLFFLSFGYLMADLQDSRSREDYFIRQSREEAVAVLVRIQRLEPTGERLRAWTAVEAVRDSSGQRAAHGRLLAYFDLTADARSLQPGDVVLLNGTVRAVPPPLNPQQFDYRSYLSYRRVYHQIFVDHWARLDHKPSLLSYAAELRGACLAVLRDRLSTPDEFSVGSALILGYKAELTESIENAYANTGAMHVLAVSGLHVGLVQLILMALLGGLPLEGRWWRYLRTLLILLGIWGFALVTGATPSVLRAATMFSFLAVGQAFERSTNVYNTLAASAFLLLCIQPLLLFHVGFQLSYLAVLGIIYFQPRIYRLWYIEHPIGDYLWKLAAVSLAAQLGTLPISLYYFHQFPLYFLLSGLIVVPAAGLILAGGLSLFVLQAVPYIGTALAQLLYWLIYVVNAGIFTLEQLPGNLIQGIWVGKGPVLLLYGILACAVIAHRSRRFRWVLIGLGLSVALAGSYAWRHWRIVQQRGITVYHLYKQSALHSFAGRRAYRLQGSNLEDRRFAFAAEQHLWWRGAREEGQHSLVPHTPVQSAGLWGKAGFWSAQGVRLFALQDAEQLGSGVAPRQDAVLLSHAPRISVGELVEEVPSSLVIADGSNPPWLAERWAAEAAAAGVRFHYTGQSGAWQSDHAQSP